MERSRGPAFGAPNRLNNHEWNEEKSKEKEKKKKENAFHVQTGRDVGLVRH